MNQQLISNINHLFSYLFYIQYFWKSGRNLDPFIILTMWKSDHPCSYHKKVKENKRRVSRHCGPGHFRNACDDKSDKVGVGV